MSYTKDIKSKTPWMTLKILSRADGALKVPFHLDSSGNHFVCEQVVRIIPGKRLVAFGLWEDQEVAIKLFYAKGNAKRDCQRDIFGTEALMQANVPTPKLLYKGAADKNRIQILVYEKITAKSIETLWQEKQDIASLTPLMRAMTIELATQHVLGILQHDLHFKNFLVTDACIYTLDGGKITKFEAPLDKKTSMTYLSLFLVQLGAGVSDLQKELFNLYTKSRGWIVKGSDKKIFKKLMVQHSQTRWQRYEKKIFRNCSAFKRYNTINKSSMYDRSYESNDLLNFLKHPDKIFSSPSALVLKSGASSTVVKVLMDNKSFVVKRYNIKNAIHWLRRCFRPTRAVKSWRLSQKLYLFGVPIAKPIAYIEHRWGWLRGKSYFVMEYIEGQHLGEYYANYSDENTLFKNMAQKVITIFLMLTELNISHGDLKYTNILIDRDRPFLIDFDGAQEHSTQSSLQHAFNNEIQRFMRNWQEQPQVYRMFHSLLKELQ